MSLNYLLRRHQLALMQAAASPTVDVRRAHEAFAAAYADRIAALADQDGATTAPLARA